MYAGTLREQVSGMRPVERDKFRPSQDTHAHTQTIFQYTSGTSVHDVPYGYELSPYTYIT